MEKILFNNVYTWFMIGAIVMNLMLGGLVFVDSPRRTINRIFALLCLALALWSITFLGLTFTKTKSSAETISRFYYACMLMVAPLFYHLVLGSIRRGSMNGAYTSLMVWFERTKNAVYVVSIGLTALVIYGLVVQDVEYISGFWLPKSNQSVLGAEFVFGFLIAGAVFVLVKSFHLCQNPAQKGRLRYIMIGIGAAALGSVFGFFPQHVGRFDAFWLFPLSHLIVSLSLLLLAYALISFHLFLFSEVTRKVLAYMAMAGILIVLYVTCHRAGEILAGRGFKDAEFAVLVITSLIVVLTYHPLRFWVQNFVDIIFFKSLYTQLVSLKGLSNTIISFSNRESFLNGLIAELRKLGFQSMCLLLRDTEDQDFKDVFTKNSEPLTIKNDSLLVQYLGAERQGEINRYLLGRRILTDWERKEITGEMERLEAEVCYPLYSSRRRFLFGTLALGDSKFGAMSYTGRNVFWLEQTVRQVTVMLENFDQAEFEKTLLPYIGREQAEELKKRKGGDYRGSLNANRCLAAIMMVDIRDFTKFTQSVTLEDVISTLQVFRTKVTAIVHRYGGVVDKFIGDAVMVVFGSPLKELEDPETSAVKCGLEIRDAFDIFNKKCEEEGKNSVYIGIGIASGEVVVGTVASPDRNEFTVIGDAVNLVARLEDVARAGQVLISDFMYENLRKKYMVKSWTTIMDGGVKGNLMFHEVLVMEPMETVQALPIV